MIYNRAVVDVMCEGEGTVNDANEVEIVPTVKAKDIGGKLRALSGRELELAQQIRASIRWEFRCRYPNIDENDWLCQQGYNRQLNVEAILPDEREIDYRILCSERQF